MQLLLVISLTFSAISASKANRNLSNGQKYGYSFYYPRTMDTGRFTKVCLLIAEKYLPAVILTTIQDEDCKSNEHIVKSGFSCWQIKVPPLSHYTGMFITRKIKIEIETKDKDIKFFGQNEVDIYRTNVKVIVKTDKEVYNVGETVNIRIIAVGFDLKPVENYKIRYLYIYCLSHGIVAQWENVSLSAGYAQFKYQLAPDAPLGRWRIDSDRVQDFFLYVFDVKNIIIPRFEAILTRQRKIFREKTPYTLCGKYSHNRNVNGVAIFKYKQENMNEKDMSTSHAYIKELKHGCAEFDIFQKHLTMMDESENCKVSVTGIIKEQATDRISTVIETVIIDFDLNEFTYQWKLDEYMKPGLPFRGKLTITDTKIDLYSTNFEFCYKIIQIQNSLVCSNFTFDSKYSIKFTIPPLRNVSYDTNSIDFHISNSQFHCANDRPAISYWETPSKRALKIEDTEDALYNCGSTLTFNISYTTDGLREGEIIKFEYIIIFREEIFNVGTAIHKTRKKNFMDQYPNVIGGSSQMDEDQIAFDRFQLKITLSKKIYKKFRLMVFYIYDNEVISDYIQIDVGHCPTNEVKAYWTKSILNQGETGTFEIKTANDSICSVSFFDKLMKDYTLLDLKKVISGFKKPVFGYKLNCILPNGSGSSKYHWDSSTFDSQTVFDDNKLSVISNSVFITKKCTNRIGQAGPGDGDYEYPDPELTETDNDLTQPKYDVRIRPIRRFLSEFWLWDLIPIKGNGKFMTEKLIPTSTTNWIGNALCISRSKGVGLSDLIDLEAAKSFFVDIMVPQSIKRDIEILHLQVFIYNYLNTSLPIRITFLQSDLYVFMDEDKKKKFTTCLKNNDGTSYFYRIKALKTGIMNISLRVETDPGSKQKCSSSQNIKKETEILQKQLLVKLQGFPNELVRSALLCTDDIMTNKMYWKLNLPKDTVPHSAKGEIIINSNIFGPILQNIKDLLVIPTGTISQTMAMLMSNVYSLKYLYKSNTLTESLNNKITKGLEIGYQHLLNYFRQEKSFSLFGDHDIYGSTVFTAFAIRVLAEMTKYTFIDNTIIQNSLNWIYSTQLNTGCFNPAKGTAMSPGMNHTTSLTAYVILNLLKSNIEVNSTILVKAKECILQDNTVNKRILAITSYALQLLNITNEAQRRSNKLMKLSITKNGLRWWSRSGKSLSDGFEIASYALLSLIHRKSKKNLEEAKPIFRWLINTLNEKDVIPNPLDTILALDAISRYVGLVYKKKPNIKMKVKTKSKTSNFVIKELDYTKSETMALASFPNYVQSNVEGDGCVAIQADVDYLLENPTNSKSFDLDVVSSCNDTLPRLANELTISIEYKLEGVVEMAILDIDLPSGYTPVADSLFDLTDPSNAYNYRVLKKYKQTENRLVFYLVDLSLDEFSFSFVIEQNVKVENVSTIVKLHNYHKREMSITKEIKVEECPAEPSFDT